MHQLKPIELLDEVLNFIKTGERWKTLKVIHVHFRDADIELKEIDLTRILLKLMDDNFVSYSEAKDYTHDHYIATFDGMLFDGYAKQKQIDDEAIELAVLNEKHIAANERSLRYATWFAGIAASLVLLWYIFSWYFPHYSDYPYHFWFEKDWINTPVKKK